MVMFFVGAIANFSNSFSNGADSGDTMAGKCGNGEGTKNQRVSDGLWLWVF